jgi:hypothetical protein
MVKRTAAAALVAVLAAITPTHEVAAAEGDEWSLSASAYAYFVPFDDNYLQPTIGADRNRLHLELRYNYEDMSTASAWVGYNFEGGSEVSFVLAPMLGGVFGQTSGIAPGYRGSVGWKRLNLFSEGEHLIDVEDIDNSFFYSWSELTFSITGWLTAGGALQRTQAYQSAREFQRGVLIGTSFERWGATFYVFDPDEPDPTWVVSGYAGF